MKLTEYEKAMLKLKTMEITQNQTIIALTAMLVNSVDANIVAEESLKVMNKAVEFTEKLIK